LEQCIYVAVKNESHLRNCVILSVENLHERREGVGFLPSVGAIDPSTFSHKSVW
jgi:hypothetical protein